MLTPLVHQFQLGAFKVTTISDGAQMRATVSPPFGIDQTRDAIAAAAQANFLPAGQFESSYTPTLVETDTQLVLFDTGNEVSRQPHGAGFLRDRLALVGYKPEDIDIVAFTHGHPDHIGGVSLDGRPTYPNASYVIGQREFDAWIKGDTIPERRNESRELFLKLAKPLAPQMTFLAPGDDVVTGIRAVEAYGHSPGQLAFLAESNGDALLIWGDLANHHVFSLQHPSWQVSLDDDRGLAVEARLRLLDMVANDRLLASGFHMPFPAVGYVERHGEGFRWHPLTYQQRI